VTFTVTDNGSPVASDSETVAITVTDANRAPVAANDAYPVNEDASLTVPAAGVLANDTDADANTLTAVLGTGPTHGTLTLNANGSFTYTPASNYSGADSFTYRANDAKADSNLATVAITVTAVNDAPTMTGVADQSTTTGTAVGPLSFTIGDVETAAASLTLSATSSNLTLVPTANIVFGGSGSARTVSVTPAANQTGTATIALTVSDGVLTASDAFVLTVTAPVPKVPGTGVFTTLSPIQKQYSDRVLMEATVTAPAKAESVTFQIGTQVLAANVPVVNGKASVSPQLLGTALTGSKIVTAVFNSAGYTIPNVTKSMSILKEDARVAYSQPTTLCLCGKASVPVTVNVSDITAIDPTIDPDAGNIGTATVTFNNRTTLATYGTVTVVPNADGKTGTATYNFPASALGTASSATITFGFIVSGSYNRNNTADNAVITITK
jgi:large repetitive protein